MSTHELPKTYAPAEAENKWYNYWLQQGYFRSTPNKEKEAYTIVIPPPNVTGVLHMGHMLNNTIQDVLIRRARMQGKEACWVPGTDHASIATEAKVVAMLKEQGIDKRAIGREAFLEHAFAWKDKYGGIILEQLKKLGASCDWERTRFTMEESLSDAVIDVFVDLYNKGLIYRGLRMVNWDPVGRTALSDEEVYHKEENSNLVYLKYMAADGSGQYLTVATTRPETIMADVAVAVNPSDERYQSWLGRQVIIPLVGRAIPVIADDYVDAEFGTGCLKVTPAHDINDYEIGQRHKLPIIEGLNEDGTISQEAGLYVGEDRFIVRKKITKDLQAAELVEKVEPIQNKMGYSERTHAAVEPRLSKQWFLKMKDLAAPALKAVMEDEIQLHPARFKSTYRVWMENVHDWCISRQLWWGHRIPAFYLPSGEVVVASTSAEALLKAQAINPDYTAADLRQDEDVLDTWFSSWLWPISVFDGFKNPDNEDIKYYYPGEALVTAPEILFFWVARMIIAGIEYRGQIPFKHVYLHGIVRDKQGRKMSKSLGNSPDPLALIEKFGADGVRVGMLLTAPAGNDLPFDEKLCEQGRNFANKLWNAFRLVQGWEVAEDLAQPKASAQAVHWFAQRWQKVFLEMEEAYAQYRISEALMTLYKLVWDDFCSSYLEMVKPAYQQPIDRASYEATTNYLQTLLKLMHPFMPFITEELWHAMGERSTSESICISAYPESASATELDYSALADFENIQEVLVNIRAIRNSKGLSPKLGLALKINTERRAFFETYAELLTKMGVLESISFAKAEGGQGSSFVVKADEFFIPLATGTSSEEEKDNLQKELSYAIGFRDSVLKKLSNEKFVANAKGDIVEREKQKLADAEAKIKTLEQALAAMV